MASSFTRFPSEDLPTPRLSTRATPRHHSPMAPSRNPNSGQGGNTGTGTASSSYLASLEYSAEELARDSDEDDDEEKTLKQRVKNAGITGAKKVKKQVDEKHAMERMYLCLLAVILLWSTSLGVSRSLVGAVIVQPDIDYVLDSVYAAFNLTSDQKQGYSQCVNTAKSECQIEYALTVRNENERIARLQVQNEEFLERIRDNSKQCQTTLVNFINKLKSDSGLQTSDIVPAHTNNVDSVGGNCLQALPAVLDGSEAALKTYTTADAYSATSKDTVTNLADRAAYDAKYLNDKNNELGLVGGDGSVGDKLDSAGNSITSETGKLAECMKSTNPPPECEGSVEEKLNGVVTSAQNRFQSVKEQVDSKISEVEAYERRMEAFANDIQNILGSDLWPPQIPKPTIPSTGITISNPVNVDELTDAVSSKVSETREAIEKNIDEAVNSINTDAGLLSVRQAYDEQMQKVNETFGDYNPPALKDDPEKMAEDFNSSSNNFLTEVAGNLQNLDTIEFDDAQGYVADSNSSVVEKVTSSAGSLTDREWSFYTYPDIFAHELFDSWKSIADLSVTFDYIYRIFRSLQLIRKYWNISAVSTPPADVRVKAALRDTNRRASRNPLQMAAYWATHPAVTFIIGIVFLILMTTTFLYMYLPFFGEYTDSCVNGVPTRIDVSQRSEEAGTFLTENAYSIAFEYAASDGDKQTVVTLDSINVERENECNLQRDNSTNIYNAQQLSENTLGNQHGRLQMNIEVLKTCLNVDSLAGATAWEKASYDSFVGNSNCDSLGGSLEDSVFKCNAISTCKEHFICTGPQQDYLYSHVWVTACTVEWLMHSAMLGTVMSMLVFAFLNVSRMTFMKGLVRIQWRRLTGDKFAYTATCLEDGTLLYPKQVTEDGYAFKALVKEKLALVLHNFTREGYLIIVFSGLINVPWILGLIFIGSNLTFSPP